MAKSPQPKPIRITFWCKPELRRKLEQRARAENRTISNMIDTLLAKALNDEKTPHAGENRNE